MGKIKKLLRKGFITLIKAYQYGLSPWVGMHCRFYPTCSQYACESISQLGILKGSWRSLSRLLRCHPFHPGGYDPVPKNNEAR